MSTTAPYPLSDDDDLALGKWCFNRTWALMSRESRTAEQDEEMLATAFASLFHWSRVGAPVNFARGHWQLARVYGLLRNPPESLRHSRRCLQITEDAGLGDFDRAYAFEGMARSLALAGDREAARSFAAKARGAAADIAEEDDRRLFADDLASLPIA